MVYMWMPGVSCPLMLDGRDLKLLSIKVDDKELKVITTFSYTFCNNESFLLLVWQNFPPFVTLYRCIIYLILLCLQILN